jgi:hypothetical protein
MPYQSRSGRSDDVSIRNYMHDVPQHNRKGSASHSEAHRARQVFPADPLGARLSTHSRGHLDAPQTLAGWNAMRHVSWQRCPTRCHGPNHQRLSHGELHRLPSGAQGEHRVRHLSFLAATLLTGTLPHGHGSASAGRDSEPPALANWIAHATQPHDARACGWRIACLESDVRTGNRPVLRETAR